MSGMPQNLDQSSDITGVQEFGATMRALKNLSEEPPTSAHDLTAAFEDIYTAFLNTRLDQFSPVELKQAAPAMLHSIFDLRIKLRAKLPEWHKKWLLSNNGQRALRDVFRVTRYVTDMLGEAASGFVQLRPGEPTYQAFTGDKINTLLNPSFDLGRGVQFQSGDVILMRESPQNSASVGHISSMDSQFSNIGIVYVDELKRLWLVQVLMAQGAVITPLEDALNNGAVRAVLLRHKDQMLAAQAAVYIQNHIENSMEQDSTHIAYDYAMDLKNNGRLFGSKLIHLAFLEASAGEVKLPTFKTKFDAKNRDFLDRIGVTVRETFTPGDMEIDPQFDIIAEWRDFRQTARVRLQDMVMDRVFDWTEEYGYCFKEDQLIWMISKLGRGAGRLSLGAKRLLADVVPLVPENMERKTLAALVMLHQTSETLLSTVIYRHHEQVKKTGLPPHPGDIARTLEQLREQSGEKIGYLHLPSA